MVPNPTQLFLLTISSKSFSMDRLKMSEKNYSSFGRRLFNIINFFYSNFMQEYENLGHMRRVKDDDSKPMDNLTYDASESIELRVLGEVSSNFSLRPILYIIYPTMGCLNRTAQ